MIFSKTFGYAVRGILYIASQQHVKPFVQAEEISSNLEAPRHFMGKILKRLAKEGMISSIKGPSGGFSVNDTTLDLPLVRLLDITNDVATLNQCVLRMRECNGANPCALHYQVESVKNELKTILSQTVIGDLVERPGYTPETVTRIHSIISKS